MRLLLNDHLGAVEVPARFRQTRAQKEGKGALGRPRGEGLYRARGLGELTLCDLGRGRIDVQNRVGDDRDATQGQGLGLREPAPVVQLERQIVERHVVLGIKLERRPVGALHLREVELGAIVVERLGQVALERREPVPMPERLRGGLRDARGRGAGVVQHDRELAVRHRECGIQAGGPLEQRDRPSELPGVVRLHGLRVFAQRFERPCGDLFQRLARADRLERLADPLS